MWLQAVLLWSLMKATPIWPLQWHPLLSWGHVHDFSCLYPSAWHSDQHRWHLIMKEALLWGKQVVTIKMPWHRWMVRCCINFEPKCYRERPGKAVRGDKLVPSFELPKKPVSVLRDFWEFQSAVGSTGLVSQQQSYTLICCIWVVLKLG